MTDHFRDRDNAWQQLRIHADTLSTIHLSELVESDRARYQLFSRRAGPLLLDLSKQRLNKETFRLLSILADSCQLETWIDRLFSDAPINNTEQRPAMHWALRAADNQHTDTETYKAIEAQLMRMQRIVAKVHAGQWRGFTGEVITDVVNIGVGGSDLGPLMTCRALEDSALDNIHPCQLHFVSTMDGSQVSHLLKNLRPQTTLFIISSKSFTTVDTLSNAATAKAWLTRAMGNNPHLLAQHFLGVSAHPERMTTWGIHPDNQLQLWEWVGGRFSLWSAIGLPIALRIGMDNFRQMLAGARFMDEHFRDTPWQDNLPVLLALVGIWNTNFLGINAHAVLPYDGRLKYLPGYLEQLEMESNGKSVCRDGSAVTASTCPILWGDIGPNAQHAFYQLLHQGTQAVTCDFIIPARRYHDAVYTEAGRELVAQHELAIANCLAQSRLLAIGGNALPKDKQRPYYKHYHGNQPNTILLLDELTPEAFGALIALYEHKVFVQSVIWNINPFDQWGVEMGKKIAEQTLSLIRDPNEKTTTQNPMDSATLGLIEQIRQLTDAAK